MTQRDNPAPGPERAAGPAVPPDMTVLAALWGVTPDDMAMILGRAGVTAGFTAGLISDSVRRADREAG